MTLPSFPLTVREPNRADAALSAALDGQIGRAHV